MDTTFCLRSGEHYCLVNGKVYGPWSCKQYAEAGMQVEQRRIVRRKLAELEYLRDLNRVNNLGVAHG